MRLVKNTIIASSVYLCGMGVAEAASSVDVCLHIPTDEVVDELNSSSDYPGRRTIGTYKNGTRYFKGRGIRARLKRRIRNAKGTWNKWTTPVGWQYTDANGCMEVDVYTMDPSAYAEYSFDIASFGYPEASQSLKLFIHPRNSGSGTFYVYSYQFNSSDFSTPLWGGETIHVYGGTEYILPRLYAIFAWVMQKGFNGNVTNKTLHVWDWFYDDPPPDGTPDNPICGSTDAAFCVHNGLYAIQARRRDLADGGDVDSTVRAYLLAHEYGHAIARMHADTFGLGTDSGSDYSNTTVGGTCGPGGTSHGMRTEEWSSAAASEGWAHYVSADIWTHHGPSDTNPGGWLHYWYGLPDATNAVNVESGNGVFTESYCQETCNCFGTGHGVELDWLRQFWDYHTNNTATSVGVRQSHHDMLNTYVGAWGSINLGTAYSDIEAKLSDADGGRWRYYAEANDIDNEV